MIELEPSEMPVWMAFYKRKLTTTDYWNFFNAFMTIMLILSFGLVVASFESPYWLGHIIWTSLLILLTTMARADAQNAPVFEALPPHSILDDVGRPASDMSCIRATQPCAPDQIRRWF